MIDGVYYTAKTDSIKTEEKTLGEILENKKLTNRFILTKTKKSSIKVLNKLMAV